MAAGEPALKNNNIQVSQHQYAISFRCPNCGEVFERAIQKGVVAEGQGGKCPNCGVNDGQPQVGRFKVIKRNQQYDEAIGPYNVPRM